MRQYHLRHPAAIIGAGFFYLSCLTAGAQTVYRCGNSYSDAPCAGASVLPINDSRSPAQKAQTDAATVQTRTLAQQMERERLALERSAMSARSPATRHKGDTAARSSSGTAAAHTTKSGKSTKKEQSEPAFFTAATTSDKKSKPTGSAAD